MGTEDRHDSRPTVRCERSLIIDAQYMRTTRDRGPALTARRTIVVHTRLAGHMARVAAFAHGSARPEDIAIVAGEPG
jgi:hypothetical protein